MDRERDTICLLQKFLDNSNKKRIFDTDAQLFTLCGENYLFTTDEYSSEDLFIEANPEILAWNLAVATLSDILAAGGSPLFYGHSMSIPSSWSSEFLERFCSGIKKSLDIAGAHFLGGDTGFSTSWKYTGIALGKEKTSLCRKGARVGDIIYMTGKVGIGNLGAAFTLFGDNRMTNHKFSKTVIKLTYRGPESETIRNYASSCIDSSDGLLKSLINLASINNLGFLVEGVPYLDSGLYACDALDLDEILLMVGECGEYELVFTVPEILEKEFIRHCKNTDTEVCRLGTMTDTLKYLVNHKGSWIDFRGFDIHARNYPQSLQYLSALNVYLEKAKTPG